MTDELLTRVLARASDLATIHDNTKYWTAVPKIHPQASPEQIASTEAAVGFELPQLLKEILVRIGNGGFGPGYGLIGVQGGYADFKGEHLAELGQELGALDRKILPICNWGAESTLAWTAPNPRPQYPRSTLRHTLLHLRTLSGSQSPHHQER